MRGLTAGIFFSIALAACTATGENFDQASEPIVDGILERGNSAVVFLYSRFGSACTASIIAPRVVLTAKHCVEGGSPSDYRVYVGSGTDNLSGEYSVSEIRRAPGRSDLRDASDVAVLILSASAIQAPLEVSFDDPSALVAHTHTAVGYGQTTTGQSGIKYRTDAFVNYVSDGFIYVDPAVCSGDSGGPLIGNDGRVWGVASYMYSRDGAPPRCGTAPGAYNTIQQYQSFIETAIEESGSCVVRTEECNGIDDDCNEVIDEGCTPFGEACTTDDECVGGLCATTSAGRVCTQECDSLKPALGCPIGFFCGAAGGCDGYCVPGQTGTLAIGEACTGHPECQTLYCADPGDGNQRCLAPCRGDTGMCLVGEACAALPGLCGGCVSEEILRGARGLGEACEADEECGSNLCLDDGGANYCTRSCSSHDQCGDGFHCRNESCVRGRLGELGASCVEPGDCGAGLSCAQLPGRSWCTHACDGNRAAAAPPDGGECGLGFSCDPTSQEGVFVCAPELALTGEDCEDSSQCLSNLCAGTPRGSICTRFCGPDNQCNSGQECVRVQGGTQAVCVPVEPKMEGSGGCTVGGAGSQLQASGLTLAGCIALSLAGWSRRRRRRHR